MTEQSYGLHEKKEARSGAWLYVYMTLLICLLLFAMSVATQEVASMYNYHKALGAPFYKTYYAPWNVFIWANKFPQAQQAIDAGTKKGQVAFALPLILVLGVWQLFMHSPQIYKLLHGSARWAKKKDIEKAGLFATEGVYVGGWEDPKTKKLHYLRHNGPEHVLVFAPTRSGKGIGLVLPTLLSWRESAIVLDIKGENWALTSGWRQRQGQRVLRFEPTDNKGTGARFNPLEEIRLHTAHAIPDTQNIASMIVDPDGKGLKDYWNKAAFALLGGAILHCLIEVRRKENRTATLSDLSLMLADPEKENAVLLQEMLIFDHGNVLEEFLGANKSEAEAVHIFVASSAREMLNKADNELSGVVSTAVANLALYRDPIVAANTAACDFRISDLMNGDSASSLYLVIRPSDIDRLRPLIRLILNIILRRLTEEMEFAEGRSVAGYKHRLLLMMDEFTSLGRLEIFERSLAFMAGYGLKTYFIVQDLTQLHAAYTKDESIMSNCHIRIAYAPNKIETAKVLSDMTGKTTVITRKTSLSGNRSGRLGKASVSMSETGRALLTPDECMRLPGAVKDSSGKIVESGHMLLFPAGFYPIYGRQILYFLDPIFSQRSLVSTPSMSDRITETPQERELREQKLLVYDVNTAAQPTVLPSTSSDSDEYEFEEPTFDGEEPDFEEPDFDEPKFVEPDFNDEESA